MGQSLATFLKKERSVQGLARIVCLYGELGSGKTTFAQGFAKGLGIFRRLPSPTFIIVRRYDISRTRNVFYHLDLYRVNSVQEVDELGVNEIFRDSNAYVIIEWAEKLGGLLPDRRTDIHFTMVSDGRHRLSFISLHK